jgi:hypothetical protein
VRGKGINYDTGFSPGGESSREHFDADVVRSEMRVIAKVGHAVYLGPGGSDDRRP